jgi:hypothetical protein
MSHEIPQPETVIWQDIELNIKRVNQQLAILSVSNSEEDAYSGCVDKITDLNLKAVEMIIGLPLKQFERQPPSFRCAVIPRLRFIQAAGIPSNYSWATICSRCLLHEDREDMVVVSSQYAESIDFDPNTSVEKLEERQVDILREAIHEHLPTLRDHYLQYPSKESLPISEAMDELVPRYILGLQKQMPVSTAFLKIISQTELLTVKELWGGFSNHDSAPIALNKAYGSSFLLGLGLIRQIEIEHNSTPREALDIWMNTIVGAKTPEEAVSCLASVAKVQEYEVWNGRSLQLKGQDYLTHY